MKQNAAAVWELAISEHPLPAASELEHSTWPEEFENGTLEKRTANIERVIRLAKYCAVNKDAIKGMTGRYIGEAGLLESEQPMPQTPKSSPTGCPYAIKSRHYVYVSQMLAHPVAPAPA